MHPSVAALFELTRSRVRERDIVDFSPADPGYDDYVRVWTEILQSGVVPKETTFDVTEVISLTGWANTGRYRYDGIEARRFREYRRLTTAVGLAILHGGEDIDALRPAPYLALDMILNVDPYDREHFQLTREAMTATRQLLADRGSEPDWPFFTLGKFVLSGMAGDSLSASAAAAHLLEDERVASEQPGVGAENQPFLWRLTWHDQWRHRWRHVVRPLDDPADANIHAVVELLTAGIID